jgi:hypothetical protein
MVRTAKAKRGRPAKPPEERKKSVMLTARIQPELKADLERARKASGNTLGKEVAFRLKRSFTQRADAWGDDYSRGLGLMVARIMTWVQEATGKKWGTDRYTYAEVLHCINAVLTHPTMLPGGPIVLPVDGLSRWSADPEIFREAGQLGKELAGVVIRDLFREATEPTAGELINDDLPRAGRLLGLKPAWKEESQS